MPTWIDYVRLHSRTTLADAPVSEQVRALHRGAELPRVRRMLVRNATRLSVDPAARSPIDLQ
jgi:hypothetical protein